MTEDVNRALAVLGVGGQAIAAVLLVVALCAVAGFRGPLDSLRRLVWGYELWLVFAVSAIATGGSLFFSEIAHYVPCELCWFQRICMYPLAIITLLAALANDHRVARYLLPLPIVGGGISIYHLLVVHGVVTETRACRVSAPGGCATTWINEFGYVTIPALALTGFGLALTFLLLASVGTATATEVPEAGGRPTSVPATATAPWLQGRAKAVTTLAVLALAAAGGIGWAIGHYAGTSDGTATATQATSTSGGGDSQLAAGRRVFVSAACGACHALEAAGSTGTVGPDLDAQKPSAELVTDRVTNGRGAMPSFKSRLTAREIRDVAAFVGAATR